MKRISLLLSGFVAVIALLMLLASSSDTGLADPRFVPVCPRRVDAFPQTFFGWHFGAPIQDGKLFVLKATSATNFNWFHYDLDKRTVTGELLNALPCFFDRDQTKLLCVAIPASTMKWKIGSWLEKFRFARALARKMTDDATFWILDLQSNSAKRIARVSPVPVDLFRPSPGFRFGYITRKTSPGATEFLLCDLEKDLLTNIKAGGDLRGWWDEQNLLLKDPGNNFVLFDVVTRQTTTLFSTNMLSKFLRRMGLPNEPAEINAYCSWNGHEIDLDFALARNRTNYGESFLLKADRAERTLKLVSSGFKFEMGGQLDAKGAHYLYWGENGPHGKGGNGAVLLRDLTDNTTRTLIEPDNAGQYPFAWLCGDVVVYSRKGCFWRVNLDGSDNVPLVAECNR